MNDVQASKNIQWVKGGGAKPALPISEPEVEEPKAVKPKAAEPKIKEPKVEELESEPKKTADEEAKIETEAELSESDGEIEDVKGG